MAFDPQTLVPLIGGLNPNGGGAFMRGFMRGQQEIQQRRQQEQQTQRQTMLDERGLARDQAADDRAQQQLMLQAENARRLAEQQRLQYTQGLQKLFTDESVDPDVAIQLATMSPPEGYDVGAIQSMASKIFTPSERQRRAAVKRLGEIEKDPQIKKLLEAGDDLSTVTFQVPQLGANPNDPEGRPLWTRGELLQMAQRPVASGPLPKVTPDRRGYQRVEAMLDGKPAFVSFDPDTSKYLDVSGQDVTARVTPMPPDRVVFPPPTPAPGSDPRTNARIDRIVGSFNSHPIVKEYNETQAQQGIIQNIVSGQWSGPGDMAAVFAFMKALDPNSVVRETEYDNAARSGNIFSGWAARFNGALNPNGGFLSERVRQDFLRTINARMAVKGRQYANLRGQLVKRIDRIRAGAPETGDEALVEYETGAEPPVAPVSPGAGASYQDYLDSRQRR